MKNIIDKIKTLNKPIWDYKDIIKVYEVGVNKAIEIKKTAILNHSNLSTCAGIYPHNTNKVNADWVINIEDGQDRLDKLKDLYRKLEIYNEYFDEQKSTI